MVCKLWGLKWKKNELSQDAFHAWKAYMRTHKLVIMLPISIPQQFRIQHTIYQHLWHQSQVHIHNSIRPQLPFTPDQPSQTLIIVPHCHSITMFYHDSITYQILAHPHEISNSQVLSNQKTKLRSC